MMVGMSNTIHVRKGGRLVPVESLASLPVYPEPDRVVWADGSESWCKVWIHPTEDGPIFARVGAGAYGNGTIPGAPLVTSFDMRRGGWEWNPSRGCWCKVAK